MKSENLAARIKQANLARKSHIANFVNKLSFDNKLSGYNKRINSNKTKHVLVGNKLNEPSNKLKPISTKDYRFSLGRIYFTSNEGLQNMFVYQPTLDTLELLKGADNGYVIS